jgi:rod shape-determining protein MreD
MRQVVTVVVALLLLLLQSTVLEFAPLFMVTPSLGLLVVLHTGLSPKWPPSQAALVAFCIGYLFDLVSGAPCGVHALVFVIMSIFVRLTATRFAIPRVGIQVLIAFTTSLITALLVVLVRAQVSHAGGYQGLPQAPIEALLTALFAPPVLWLFGRIDGQLSPGQKNMGFPRDQRRALVNRLHR